MNERGAPDATVIVVSFNTCEILRRCLKSLAGAGGGLSVETIVVDNASRDASADLVAREFPWVRLVRSETNLGFAAANNVGFELASGRYLVLLNPDAELRSDGLAQAIERMDENPRTGLAGARLVNRHGDDEPSARSFPSLVNEVLVLSGLAARFPHSRLFGRFDRTWADPASAAEVDWVPGAFVIIRREALRAVGPFDERFFLYYEEVDLCRRLRAAGWAIWYWPEIVVRHLGGESAKTIDGSEISSSGSQLVLWRMRSALLYYRKHHGYLNARLLATLEIVWHGLRRLKAGLTASRPASEARAAESARLVGLMRRAWKETRGGRISPSTPW